MWSCFAYPWQISSHLEAHNRNLCYLVKVLSKTNQSKFNCFFKFNEGLALCTLKQTDQNIYISIFWEFSIRFIMVLALNKQFCIFVTGISWEIHFFPKIVTIQPFYFSCSCLPPPCTSHFGEKNTFLWAHFGIFYFQSFSCLLLLFFPGI